MEGLTEVLATADELYGLVPEAFVAARDEHVRRLRRDGARARALAVKDLRRPSVAAWLVNAMVRHRRDELEQLLQLGAALREAQGTLDADQLRELNRQRQAVLTAIGKQARALAQELGRPVSEQVAAEVEQTLRAALADPAAAGAVRSGRLTAALSYAGFGDADASDAVALPAVRERADLVAPAVRALPAPNGSLPGTAAEDAPETRPTADDARQTAARDALLREAMLACTAAEDAARRAEGSALVAEQHRDTLQRRARIARERLDAAHARVAELESLLSAAREAASTAAAAWAPVHAEADAAAVRADAARGVADSARAMLESARVHLAEARRQG